MLDVTNLDSRRFLYTTRDGHSWQTFRNQRWLDWIETGVLPEED